MDNLTLTSVVFEFSCVLVPFLVKIDLTLTSVVFELQAGGCVLAL